MPKESKFAFEKHIRMIRFNTENIKFNLKNKAVLKKWIAAVVEDPSRSSGNSIKGKRTPGEINFIFCSDEYLLNINKQYLKHDTYTDIITFDYSKEDPALPVSGDVFISIERVKENAEKFSKTFENELHRVIIHGTLHLLGHKDKTKEAKEKMTKQEDLCLKELQKI